MEQLDDIDLWLRDREQQFGPSRTAVEYRNAVLRLERELLAPALSATRRQLLDHMAHLQIRGLSAATRRKELSGIRAFFRWAKTEGRVAEDIALPIPMPKLPKRLPRALPEDVISRVTIHAGRTHTVFLEARDRALFALLYATGMRRAEAAGLRMADYHGSWARVVGKGDKERRVYVDAVTQASMASYMTLRPRSDWVFCKFDGDQISAHTVWKIVQQAFLRSGIKGSTHTLRHSYATRLYKKGMDIYKIQRLLGHSSIETTEVYVAVADDEVEAAYRTAVEGPSAA